MVLLTDALDAMIFIPLHFWFCRNPGLALPLIALQYHEVKINITISERKFLATADVISQAHGESYTMTALKSEPDFSNFKLFADYIYLDTDERRRFAQVSHEYLIEQLQFQELSTDKILNLNFNHPVKELIWYGVPKYDPRGTTPGRTHIQDYRVNLFTFDSHDRRGAAIFSVITCAHY